MKYFLMIDFTYEDGTKEGRLFTFIADSKDDANRMVQEFMDAYPYPQGLVHVDYEIQRDMRDDIWGMLR